MNPILFSSAKGAERVMYAQQVRANNLANADTVGFKSLMEHSQHMRLEGSGFESSVTARTNSAMNNFREGDSVTTGKALDVTILGTGFFTVEGKGVEGEEAFTRAGNFRLDEEGQLMLGSRRVIGADGPIVIPDHESLNIDNDGIISIVPLGGGAIIEAGALKLVNPDYSEMTLSESGYFMQRDAELLPTAADVSVQSGALERSNVSSIEELVAMMSLTRQYEMQVKVMASADEIAQIGNRIMRD
ncbi:flagellar basal body [Vibrio sp. B1FLJ16]|uniref:flagellar basal body rod protein FlgF n=1 Tax=Vibrio sp. B1FLJ16 TaxID=2751178 RepID=UPI0015F42A90|nr:flagellar basal body rod protein FlgF [Vibrio sp. B1FLJ16]CAD7811209.1 flagellar basal body [Vibrio sp. B1FLJ16]CAE6914393.1 flagellar basal body [Vibrio sp. B1FLJ16]